MPSPKKGSPSHGKGATSTDNPVQFAAAVYPHKKGKRRGLARFVESLKKSRVRVAGILQEKVSMDDSGMSRVDAIDITTGQRIPLNRPTRENWKNRTCSLDVSALAETTAILRRAIENRVDLIVVEKFGDEEREGKGLTNEIFQGIAAGIPLLIAVPDTNLDIWNDRSGGIGAVLPCEENAFHEWWISIQGATVGSVRRDFRLGGIMAP